MIRPGCLCIALPQIRDKEELVFSCQSISINACKVWHQLPRESSQLHSMEIPNLLWHQSKLRLSVPFLMIRMIFYMISTIIWNKWNLITSTWLLETSTLGLIWIAIQFHPEVIGRHCFYDTSNNNGERLVDLSEEFKLSSCTNEIPPSEASSLDVDASIRINTPVRPHSHQQQVEKFNSEL